MQRTQWVVGPTATLWRCDTHRSRGLGECLRRTQGEVGKKLGITPVERFMVNVGTEPSPCFMDDVRDRAARCPLKDSSVVVREQESRLHGEGRQQDEQQSTGKPALRGPRPTGP